LFVLRLQGAQKGNNVRFAIQKLWLENSQNPQQSTVELAVFVNVPMGEGAGSMAAKARLLNW
jgi:hypothetical protein